MDYNAGRQKTKKVKQARDQRLENNDAVPTLNQLSMLLMLTTMARRKTVMMEEKDTTSKRRVYFKDFICALLGKTHRE